MMRTKARGLFVAFAFVAACNGSQATSTTATTAPATSASATAQAVTIDPALERSGRIAVEVATRRPPRGQTTVPGEVEAAEGGIAEVTSLVSGRVASLPVKVGDTVTKGQSLCTLDAPEAGRAQADLLRARGRSGLAARALARQLELDAEEATSKAAVDQARAEDRAAAADVAAARAVLSSLGAAEPGASGGASASIALRAPIAGTVVSRSAVLGGAVVANATLFRIVSGDRAVVVAHLPETSPLHPLKGDAAVVTSRRASDVACNAVVDLVVPFVDASRTRTARVVPDATCTLVPGTFVEVRFHDAAPSDAGSALYVPTTAIVELRGVSSVFVAGTTEGSYSVRPVDVGTSSGDDTEITRGVASGDRVVVTGALLLKGELLKKDLQ